MKETKIPMRLQLFAEGGEGGGQGGAGGDPAPGGGSTQRGNPAPAYTYEQAEEIAQARAQKAEADALKGYFQKQGMSEAEVTQAIADFREKQKSRQPNVAALEAERDEAQEKLQQYENEKVLAGMRVKQEDLDYVAFKVGRLVTDKKDFKTAAAEWLKENPRYAVKSNYRVSTGADNTQGSGGTQTGSEMINEAIRSAIRGR